MQLNMSTRSDQFFDFETDQYSGGRQRGMGSTMSMTSTEYDVDSIATQFGSMSFDQMSTQSYSEGSYAYPYPCPYPVHVPVPVPIPTPMDNVDDGLPQIIGYMVETLHGALPEYPVL